MIDARASERHFFEHIAPVWEALPRELRGVFVVSHGILREARSRIPEAQPMTLGNRNRTAPVLVASYIDLRRTAPRPAVLMEHGAGQTYKPAHRSYAGGPGRQRVKLFLCPSERVAEINRAAYPDATAVVVGCPMLDAWHGRDYPRDDPPTVVVSFHWDSRVSPETRTAFPHYRPALHELAAALDLRIVGHGHPRIIDRLAPSFRAEGIPVWRDFEQVLAESDLYVCDNSSSLFMFAATGRPVVVLNAPWYRRDVDHGLRFWDAADVGIQIDQPGDLLEAIRTALSDPPEQRRRREEIVAGIYAHRDGSAAAAAADAIATWLGARSARAAA